MTRLSCTCGKVQIEVTGKPVVTAECCCDSCRAAGDRFELLPGTPTFRTPLKTTPYVLQRKDRFRIVSGAEQLRDFYLTPQSHTRRVVAACCNTPLFAEFQAGHWLSVYASLWPDATRPRMEMRTMAGDLPATSILPNDMPNLKSQSGGFFGKLLWAWIAMGFRVPRIAANPPLDA
jgi:hypothetical protein